MTRQPGFKVAIRPTATRALRAGLALLLVVAVLAAIPPAAATYTVTGPQTTSTVAALTETSWNVQKNGDLVLTAYTTTGNLVGVDFSSNDGGSWTSYTCATCASSSTTYLIPLAFTADVWVVLSWSTAGSCVGQHRTIDHGSSWTTTACGVSGVIVCGVPTWTINGGTAALAVQRTAAGSSCTYTSFQSQTQVFITTNNGASWTDYGAVTTSAGTACGPLTNSGAFMWESSVNLFYVAPDWTTGCIQNAELRSFRSTNLAAFQNADTTINDGVAPITSTWGGLKVASTNARYLSWIDAAGQWVAEKSTVNNVWSFKLLGAATSVNGKSWIEECPSGKHYVLTNGMTAGDSIMKMRFQTNGFTDSWTESLLSASTTDGTAQNYAQFLEGDDAIFFTGKQSAPYYVQKYAIENICDGTGTAPGGGDTGDPYNLKELFCSVESNARFGYNFLEGVTEWTNQESNEAQVLGAQSIGIDHGYEFKGDVNNYDYLAKTFAPASASKAAMVVFRIESLKEAAGNSVFRAGFSMMDHVSAGWQNPDLTLTSAAKGDGGDPADLPASGAFEDYIEVRFQETEDGDDWQIRVYLYYAGGRSQLGSGVTIDDPDAATYYSFLVDTNDANAYYKVRRLVNTGSEYEAQTISNGPLERRLEYTDNAAGDPRFGLPASTTNAIELIHDRLLYSQWFVGASTTISDATTLLDNGNREHTSPSTCIYDPYGVAVVEGDQGNSGPRASANGTIQVINDPGNSAAATATNGNIPPMFRDGVEAVALELDIPVNFAALIFGLFGLVLTVAIFAIPTFLATQHTRHAGLLTVLVGWLGGTAGMAIFYVFGLLPGWIISLYVFLLLAISVVGALVLRR